MTFKNFHKNNGSKGGRPKQDSKIYVEIPEIKFVNLTPKQYDALERRYGHNILLKALLVLDNWLGSGSPKALKYLGKNNYAHFRSDGWVINEVLKK
jgi:hypothetical protein